MRHRDNVRELHKHQQIQDIICRNKYIVKSRTNHKLSKSIPVHKRNQLESFGEADLERVTPTVPPQYNIVSMPKDINELLLTQIP